MHVQEASRVWLICVSARKLCTRILHEILHQKMHERMHVQMSSSRGEPVHVGAHDALDVKDVRRADGVLQIGD